MVSDFAKMMAVQSTFLQKKSIRHSVTLHKVKVEAKLRKCEELYNRLVRVPRKELRCCIKKSEVPVVHLFVQNMCEKRVSARMEAKLWKTVVKAVVSLRDKRQSSSTCQLKVLKLSSSRVRCFGDKCRKAG